MKKFTYFIYAARFKTLIAALSPIIICASICYKHYSLNFNTLILTVLAALLIQIMTNFINDLYDFKKGADHSGRLGPDRMIQKGLISEQEMVQAIYVVFFIALAIGAYLATVGGWIIVLIGTSAFLFAYLYTATNFSIAYNGLGEIFVFLYFGIIASMGTFYLQLLEYSDSALLVGVICGCFNMILLIINNIRDMDTDRIYSKKTLIVRFGKFFGYLEFGAAIIIAHVSIYFLSINLDNQNILIVPYVLSAMPIYILIKSIYSTDYLNNKALYSTSLYITLFTLLSTYIIIQ